MDEGQGGRTEERAKVRETPRQLTGSVLAPLEASARERERESEAHGDTPRVWRVSSGINTRGSHTRCFEKARKFSVESVALPRSKRPEAADRVQGERQSNRRAANPEGDQQAVGVAEDADYKRKYEAVENIMCSRANSYGWV